MKNFKTIRAASFELSRDKKLKCHEKRKKKTKYIENIKSFECHKSYKIREYSQLQGLLVLGFLGSECSILYTRNE